MGRWPEIYGALDKASLYLRLTRCQRPLTPVVEQGHLSFVTDTAETCATVLRERPEVYERPQHPYPETQALLGRLGRFVMGFDRESGAGRQAFADIQRVLKTEALTACADFARSETPIRLLPASRELMLRAMSRILYDVDASPWSRDFVEAAAFVEAWQVLVRNEAHRHPALRSFLEASEIRQRAAAAVLRARTEGAKAVVGANPRGSIVETLMNGYNGLAMALAWVFCELARHPRILSAVQAEVDADAGDVPLPFVRQVVLECLRLHPPAWVLGRLASRADRLGPQFVPKGTTLLCCVYAVHRNPDTWPQPDVFEPARFGTRHRVLQHSHALLPFGLGAHACPAGRLVPRMLEAVISAVLQSYEVEVDNGQPIGNRALISLMPNPDPIVRFTPRTPRTLASSHGTGR